MSWPNRSWQSETLYCDPRTALADVKAAHHWAKNELKSVRPGSIREYCLTQEKKRLCELAWKIKRQIG